MKNSLLYFIVSLILTSSLSIYCSSTQSFTLPPGSNYKVQVISDLPNHSFIIGSNNSSPSLSFNSTSSKWSVSLSLYSLESYLNSSNSLPIPSVTSTTNISLSVCAFDSTISTPPHYEITKTESICSNCSGNGDCLNNICKCFDNFFGDDCSLEYIQITDYYKEDFEIDGYSLLFFQVNTTQQLYIKEDVRTVHVFVDNTSIPSFFHFMDYSTPYLDYKNKSESVLYFSLFCPQSYPCALSIYGSERPMSVSYIVLLSVFIPIAIGLIVIIVLLVCRRRNQKLVLQGLNIKEIEKLAPVAEWNGQRENDICTVCLTNFKEKEKLRRIKKCEHFFHPECLDEWLKQKPKCPNCNLVMR